MERLLLAEQLFLLTHNDDSGKTASVTALDQGFAGGLLLDLATDELITVEDSKLRALPGQADHPLLAAAHTKLMQSEKPRDTKYWVGKLPSSLRPLSKQIGQSLGERGILEERKGKLLGLFPNITWPEVDPAPERQLRNQLRVVLVDGAEPDPRTLLLISLLEPLDLIGSVVDKPDRKAAKALAKTIVKDSAGGPTAKVLGEAVQAIQIALMIAILVPTVVAATSS